jgi:hypothetical protein
MAKLRKSDAFRYGSFNSDLAGEGKRMWINHSSMKVVIAANMGVNNFDMSPGFPDAGTWYEYFSGQSIQVSDPGGHKVNFGPGQYKVYTNVKLPVPFYRVAVTVTDSTNGLAVTSAKVTFPGQDPFLTAADGKVTLTPAPGSQVLTISKPGYKTYTKTIDISSNTEVSVKLKRDANYGINYEQTSETLLIYPNPATDFVHIKAEQKYSIICFNSLGKIVLQQTMKQDSDDINISKLPKGIYILQFNDGQYIFTRKILKN